MLAAFCLIPILEPVANGQLPALEDHTLLTRFAFDRNQVKPDKLPPRAFMPSQEEDGTWVLSTFRIDGLDEGAIWRLATPRQGREVRARADLPVSSFAAAGLTLDFDDDPPRHVSVKGWSDDDAAQNVAAATLSLEVLRRRSVKRNPHHPDYARG